MLDRREQRPAQQVLGREQVGLVDRAVAQFSEADAQQLSLVVPFVERFAGVDTLVALQPEERRSERAGQRFRRLRLADAGLALEEDRLRKAHREEQCGRERVVGEVVVGFERGRQCGDVGYPPPHVLFGPRARLGRHPVARSSARTLR